MRSFGEFVCEIRAGQHSAVHAALPLRILEASWDILRPYRVPNRERWTDRIFTAAKMVARPLSTV
jgi:hypothetical protein